MRSLYGLYFLILLLLLPACGGTPATTPEAASAPTDITSALPTEPSIALPLPSPTADTPSAPQPATDSTMDTPPVVVTVTSPPEPAATTEPTLAPSPTTVPTAVASPTTPPPTASPVAAVREEIAFVRGGEILSIAPEGGRARTLVTGANAAPAWSPSGSGDLAYIALEGSTEGGALVIREPGGETRRLVRAGVTQLAWSPDGTRIAYTRTTDRDGDGLLRPDSDQSRVRVVSLPGGEDRRVARGFDPSWTPEGQQVLLSTPGRMANGVPERNELRLYSLDSGTSEIVVRTSDVPEDLRQYGSPFIAATRLLRYGAVAPDGETVTFSALGGVGVLGTVEPEGKVQVQDILPESGFGPIVWEPEGTRIAYSIPEPSGANVVSVLDIASGNRVSFGNPRDPDSGYEAPAWSPDRTALALVRTGPNGPAALVLAPLDEGQEQVLVDGNVASPTWNPSGSRTSR